MWLDDLSTSLKAPRTVRTVGDLNTAPCPWHNLALVVGKVAVLHHIYLVQSFFLAGDTRTRSVPSFRNYNTPGPVFVLFLDLDLQALHAPFFWAALS